MKKNLNMVVYGGVIGLIATILVMQGNPGNMGLCIACFWRDVTGALGLHSAPIVQYMRPEILGIVFGSFVIAIATGEFNVRGGSNPIIRFILGFFTMIGALMFLGCPMRMILRLANGDLNALVGLFGYIVGIYVGVQFLKQGYSLGRSYEHHQVGGFVMPIVVAVFFIFMATGASFIRFSTEGPGSMHAPIFLSLIAGLIVGVVLQRSRICTAGAFRDLFIMKDFHYLYGIIGIFAINLIANLVLNGAKFKLGFVEQPVAHNAHLWNFLGMVLTGLCSCLLGGCPIRQSVLSGQGDTDAGVTVLGLIVGAAFAHNFSLASSGKGPTPNGKVAVIIGLIVVSVIALMVIKSNKKVREKLNA